MKSAFLSLIIVALLGATTLAQDKPDPEVLFHQSYIQEVVQGRVEVAALGYLKLMNDESVPAALRAESRFRFAICCVLLGRPDEARHHLAALLDDDTAPKSVRIRAKEYRASLQALGVGSELGKKLDALTFELGRAKLSAGSLPPTYRDFQIIGAPAVPFLTELLGHPDDLLRQHAFRILLRMDEPGLVETFNLERFGAYGVLFDLAGYLRRNASEGSKFEEMVKLLPGEDVNRLRRMLRLNQNWSLEFIDAISKKRGCAELASELALSGPFTPERVALIKGWLGSGDPELRWFTAGRMVDVASGRNGDAFHRPEFFLQAVEIFVTGRLDWVGGCSYGRVPGHPAENQFEEYSDSMEHATLVRALTFLLDLAESWEGDPLANPLANGLAKSTVHGLFQGGISAETSLELGSLVLRWMKVRTGEVYLPYVEDGRYTFPDRGGVFTSLARRVFRNLPAKAAAEFVSAYMRLDPKKGDLALFSDGWRVRRPGDMETLLAAFREAPARSRGSMVYMMQMNPDHLPEQTRVVAAEILASLPTLIEILDRDFRDRLLSVIPGIVVTVEPGRAIETIISLAPLIGQLPEKQRGYALRILVNGSSLNLPLGKLYRRSIAVPALQPLWEASDEISRVWLVRIAVGLLSEHGSKLPLNEALSPLCAFLLAHIEEIDPVYYEQLVPYRELIPLESWVPLATSLFDGSGRTSIAIPTDAADAAAYRMAADPAIVNDAVLGFMRMKCSSIARQSVLEKIVAECRGKDLARTLNDLGRDGAPVTLEILEARLLDLLKAGDADIGNLAALAEKVARAKPTEKLFPAVLRLLQSGEKRGILAGSRVAKSLGRTELLTPLFAVLSSMDPEIRNAAKSAMDSIRELQKLRAEQKLREAGMLPR